MAVGIREIYRSENGDRWSLVHDPESDRVFVRHQPNRPSGGQASSISLGTFLADGRSGPEHQALLQMIGTLVSGQSEP